MFPTFSKKKFSHFFTRLSPICKNSVFAPQKRGVSPINRTGTCLIETVCNEKPLEDSKKDETTKSYLVFTLKIGDLRHITQNIFFSFFPTKIPMF